MTNPDTATRNTLDRDTVSAQTIDELSGQCFGCGPANPQGLHLHFTLDPLTDSVTAPVQLSEIHQGAPGYIHGGLIATLLDEAMSKLNRPLGLIAMTRHIEVDYLRPAPIHQPLTLSGRHLRRDGRKLFHAAELHDRDGNLLARCTGLWIVIPREALPLTPAHTPVIEPA